MKKISKFSLVLIPVFIIFSLMSCNENSSPTTTTTPTGGNQNNYNSVSNFGDVIRLSITSSGKDAAGGDYSWTNETLNQTGSGTFTVSNDPHLTGIYFTNNSNYIIEAPNLSFLTTLNFGRPQNFFSFGINSNQNLNNTSFIGEYLFISFDVDTSGVYGGYRINTDGTFTYGIAPEDPANITNFNYFQGDGSGTWVISHQDSSRILLTEGGETVVGMFYPEKYMEISLGAGQGMILGIKYPSAPLTLSQVAGTYRGFDFSDDGNVGIGYYTIPSVSGPVTYYFHYLNPPFTVEGTTSGNINRHPGINNTFVFNDEKPNEYNFTAYCIVLGGECMMHFALPNDTTSTYSAGVSLRIN